jgi:adenosylmethionine-8-amino-7-oxononanoate aminotransferase
MFACEHASVSPDIMCLSKGLTGGYLPMALAVTTDEIYNAFYADYREHKAFMHSHTYCGNPLACAAAVEVLDILSGDNVIARAGQKAKELAPYTDGRLADLPHAGDVRRTGLITAIELVEDKARKRPFNPDLRIGYRVYKRALQKGVLLRPLGDVLYFNPPLIIEKEDYEFMADVCAECIREVKN